MEQSSSEFVCRMHLSKYFGSNPEVIIPDGVEDIVYCLSEVGLPNSITDIGEYAFRGCKSLSHIYIPDSVEEIGKKAFASCAKGFILQSSNPKWQAYALKEKLKFELIDDPYVK